MSEEKRKRIIEMLRENRGAKEISAEVGISVKTIYEIKQKISAASPVQEGPEQKTEDKPEQDPVDEKPKGGFRTPYSRGNKYYISRY